MWWRKRRPLLIKKIQELDPDVVFLQEIILKNNLRHFELPGYEVCAVKGRIFAKGGLVILSKLKIKNFYFQKFQAQGKIFSQQITDRMLGKGFLVAHLENGQTLVNTHLVSFYYGPPEEVDHGRKSQTTELISSIKHHPKIIMGGDFNFIPTLEEYSLIREHLHDTAEGDDPTFENYKVDYIFSHEAKKPIQKFIVGGDFSDHRGIFIEV